MRLAVTEKVIIGSGQMLLNGNNTAAAKLAVLIILIMLSRSNGDNNPSERFKLYR